MNYENRGSVYVATFEGESNTYICRNEFLTWECNWLTLGSCIWLWVPSLSLMTTLMRTRNIYGYSSRHTTFFLSLCSFACVLSWLFNYACGSASCLMLGFLFYFILFLFVLLLSESIHGHSLVTRCVFSIAVVKLVECSHSFTGFNWNVFTHPQPTFIVCLMRSRSFSASRRCWKRRSEMHLGKSHPRKRETKYAITLALFTVSTLFFAVG